jgi:hypothetical protein
VQFCQFAKRICGVKSQKQPRRAHIQIGLLGVGT